MASTGHSIKIRTLLAEREDVFSFVQLESRISLERGIHKQDMMTSKVKTCCVKRLSAVYSPVSASLWLSFSRDTVDTYHLLLLYFEGGGVDLWR